MNLLIKIILSLIIVSIIPVQSFSQNCKGTLIVNTDKSESLIYLNSELIGKGNIEIELDEGIYFVSVKENKNIWEERIFSEMVNLKNCNHQTLTFKFDNEIYLQTIPQDAAVFLNDSLLGYTPLYLAANYSSLQLQKPGYESKYININDYQPNKSFVLDFIGKEKELSFYEKDLFKYLLAGIVVLGGTTAYFKLKADNKFEEYQMTGEKKLLDETERYDLISGITFTALQINFGALIYFFLND